MEERNLSRREALKALTAASGAVAFAGLPAAWVTPIMQKGALPAHALATLQPFVEILSAVDYSGVEKDLTVGYYLPEGFMTWNVTVEPASNGGCSVSTNFDPYVWFPDSFDQLTGDKYQGTVQLLVYFFCCDCSTVKITVTVTDGDSNTFQANVTVPPPD